MNEDEKAKKGANESPNGGQEKEATDQREMIEIPTLPRGRLLSLRLLSNWGDPTWIGISGIEIFLESGVKARLEEVLAREGSTAEFLPSINQLTTFSGVSWKSPLMAEGTLTLTIRLSEEDSQQSIAMIRIWNYNESRVHANRGVRELEMLLDDHRIFKGIIETADDGDQGETILFTTCEHILEAIAQHDVCILPDAMDRMTTVQSEAQRIIPQRPITAERNTSSSHGEQPPQSMETRKQSDSGKRPVAEISDNDIKVLHLELESTWGVQDCIGMTGVEFFDVEGKTITMDDIATVSVLNGDRGVERLLNGRNLSRSPSDMWLSSFSPSGPRPTIIFTFHHPLHIAGVSLWNYNASVELSYAGVRTMNIHANGKCIKKNVLLRKATGFVYFDFVQDISFDRRRSSVSPSALALRPGSKNANGFIFQLTLLSTWGDEFYTGLNGVELRDAQGKLIDVRPQNLAAFPESVNILPQVQDDPRRSENLINGINEEECAKHSWLTPVLPNRSAHIFFVFDAPTSIARVVVYNYRKTPSRGVRHLSISVDDVIIWSGEIAKYSPDVQQNGIVDIPLRESSCNE